MNGKNPADEKTAAYLDELIGQNEKIRPMVQSGNEMLDVILNGKLSAAADAGIAVELVRTQAPDKLPLTDAELCSLVMNLLDNALEAAAAPERGLGLKAVRQIIGRYGNLSDTEYGEGYYRVTVLLPLHQPLK